MYVILDEIRYLYDTSKVGGGGGGQHHHMQHKLTELAILSIIAIKIYNRW